MAQEEQIKCEKRERDEKTFEGKSNQNFVTASTSKHFTVMEL